MSKAEKQLTKLSEKLNSIFNLVILRKKDGKDIEGRTKRKDGKLCFSEIARRIIRKNHEDSMNEKNDWSHMTK